MKTMIPLWAVLWLAALDFIVFIIYLTVPGVFTLLGSNTFFVLAALFPVLGTALLVLTLTGGFGGALKQFLILTSAAAVSSVIGFGLIVFSFGNEASKAAPGMFLFGLIISGLIVVAFPVGVVGTMVQARREKRLRSLF